MQQQAESFMLPRADIQAAILQKLSSDGGSSGSHQREGSQTQLDPVPELQQLDPTPPSTADPHNQSASRPMQTTTSSTQLLTSGNGAAHEPCILSDSPESSSGPAFLLPADAKRTLPDGFARTSASGQMSDTQAGAGPDQILHQAGNHEQPVSVEQHAEQIREQAQQQASGFGTATDGQDAGMQQHPSDDSSRAGPIPYPIGVRDGDRSTPGIAIACQLVQACIMELEDDRRWGFSRPLCLSLNFN